MGVIFTFLMGLFMSFEAITDNDYFWHVAVGKWIDINKTIPNKPLFSWWGLQENYNWTSHEWLTEWIMYKLGDCASALFYLERAIQCSANKVDKEILSHYKEVTKKCK